MENQSENIGLFIYTDLLSILRQVFHTIGVVPHTSRHELRCETERMLAADPTKKLDLHPHKLSSTSSTTTFSGYGIFNLSAKLGSRFLDKLDSVVDYGATCRITAIHLHVDEINVFEKYEKSIS
ncbi:4825_t:CDS:2 [Entrophospora sp. SA101]|nr:4825_t:CDS:2 [Entrophospora sp. SA101]